LVLLLIVVLVIIVVVDGVHEAGGFASWLLWSAHHIHAISQATSHIVCLLRQRLALLLSFTSLNQEVARCRTDCLGSLGRGLLVHVINLNVPFGGQWRSVLLMLHFLIWLRLLLLFQGLLELDVLLLLPLELNELLQFLLLQL